MTRDWYVVHKDHKKVHLCNAEHLKNVSESSVSYALMRAGLHKWENYLASIFVEAVQASDNDVADITKMFSCDLCGVDHLGTYCKKQEDVIVFLMDKLFEIVEESDTYLSVEIKSGVFN